MLYPDGQYIQTQQILIINIPGNPVDQADARVFHKVGRIPGKKPCQVEKPENQEYDTAEPRKQCGKQQIQREESLNFFLFISAQVFAAENCGAACQHGADRTEKCVDRAVQADRAHGVDADVVGGKKAGNDAVDGVYRSKKNLDRQQAKQQLRNHFRIGFGFVHIG